MPSKDRKRISDRRQRYEKSRSSSISELTQSSALNSPNEKRSLFDFDLANQQTAVNNKYCRMCRHYFTGNEDSVNIFVHPDCGCSFHSKEYNKWIETDPAKRAGLCPFHQPSGTLNASSNMSDSDAELYYTSDSVESDNSATISDSSVDTEPKKRGPGRPKKKKGGPGRPRKTPKLELESDANIISQAEDDLIAELRSTGDTDSISVVDSIADSVFLVPSIPSRRSSRTRRPPSSASTVEPENWPAFCPVTNSCHTSHFGRGCGAKSARHSPHYYNSIEQGFCNCPFCKALLFRYESIGQKAFSMCCAKGRVDLLEKYNMLQSIPIEIDNLIHGGDPANSAWRKNLMENAIEINSHLAFGHIRIQHQPNFPYWRRIVKCNGMLEYVLWDYNPPQGAGAPFMHGQLFTIPAAQAHERLNEMVAEKDIINPSLLRYLYDVLRENHWMASLYNTAAEMYRELDEEERDKFRMLIVDTTKKGNNLTIENPDATPVQVQIHPDDQRNLHQIHPGRICVQNELGSKLVAQFYLDNGANVPLENRYDVVLKGRQGTGMRTMKWWNQDVDTALFPLLFPKGQFGFVGDMKLRLNDGETFVARGIRTEDGQTVDPDDDLGEGQEFLDPDSENMFKRRDRVSRSQYFRYMSQIRGKYWKTSHWLWNWGHLAQLYTITFCQRMQAEKVQYIKRLQDRKRFVRIRALLEGSTMAFVRMDRQNDSAAQQGWRFDQFHQIRMMRYVTSFEAWLELYGFPLVKRSHIVQELDIHTPEGRRVMVEEDTVEEVAERERERIAAGREQKTQLTAFFEFNQERHEKGFHQLHLTYDHAFKKLRYDTKQKKWKQYVISGKEDTVLTRIKTVSPTNRELLSIRLLLLNVEDPCNWIDLRTFNGIVYDNFVDAAVARGLFEDNEMWKRAVDEAFRAIVTVPRRMRWLAMFLATVNMSQPKELLDDILNMPEEWLINTRVAGQSLEVRRQFVLRAIEWHLRANGVRPDDSRRDDDTYESACEHIGLPRPEGIELGPELLDEAEFNPHMMLIRNLPDDLLDDEQQRRKRLSDQRYYLDLFEKGPKLNDEQQKVFEDIHGGFINARYNLENEEYDRNIKWLNFLTGEGGAGKTVLMNALIAMLKANEFSLFPMGSTGIAAECLHDGSTVHKRLCRRRHVDHSSEPDVDPQSYFGRTLKEAHGFIIDEISMQNRVVLEFVDRLFKSVLPRRSRLHNFPFAGKAVIISGDWKQLLPVVPGGSDLDQYCASVKNSILFPHFETKRLLRNQRLRAGNERYRLWIKRLGTGVLNGPDDRVEIPKNLCIFSRAELIDFVFPQELMNDPLKNWQEFRGRAILCPLNVETFQFIDLIMNRLNGAERYFDAVTSAVQTSTTDSERADAAAGNYENLIKNCPSGVPQHRLRVKIGSVMMLIVNLSVENGLCNGTRVQILAFTNNLIQCRILSGSRVGDEVFLYRIKFVYGADPHAVQEGPVRCQRIQFPLRPGNAMTINKSQSQTLSRVGVALDRSQCFAHGQLYTSVSRATDVDSIRICISRSDRLVKNVVCQKIIDEEDLREALETVPVDNDDPHPQRPPTPTRVEEAILNVEDFAANCVTSTPIRPRLRLNFSPHVNRTHLNKINVVAGDIAKVRADIIVNAANNTLQRGAGVCGAIFRACEPEMKVLEQECATKLPQGASALDDGTVVETLAYGTLKANSVQFILHAVGPRISGNIPTDAQRDALKNCYTRSLDFLLTNKLRTIAFPSISTGIFGYPRDEAAFASFESVLDWLCADGQSNMINEIIFVGYKDNDRRFLKNVWEMAKRQIVQSRRGSRTPGVSPAVSRSSTPAVLRSLSPIGQNRPQTASPSPVFLVPSPPPPRRSNDMPTCEQPSQPASRTPTVVDDNVPPTGDCLFWAIVRCLHGNSANYARQDMQQLALRRLVQRQFQFNINQMNDRDVVEATYAVEWNAQHVVNANLFLDHDDHRGSLLAYSTYMMQPALGRDTLYGGHLEILMAETALNRPIIVLENLRIGGVAVENVYQGIVSAALDRRALGLARITDLGVLFQTLRNNDMDNYLVIRRIGQHFHAIYDTSISPQVRAMNDHTLELLENVPNGPWLPGEEV